MDKTSSHTLEDNLEIEESIFQQNLKKYLVK